jgi:PAS domain S-box-containing protein
MSTIRRLDGFAIESPAINQNHEGKLATILIVDNLPAHRRFLATVLLHEGHRILEAADGREGLAAARIEHPDLVITDVLMPVMDGYEFFRQLRLDPGTKDIPVVFHTAHYGRREAQQLALSSGVSYVLTKPASTADVVNIVNRILSGGSDAASPDPVRVSEDFARDHLRLLTDQVSEKAEDLRAANARLRALINIGLEFASERDSDLRLEIVCASACDLFSATYTTLSVLDADGRTVRCSYGSGADSCEWVKTGDSISGLPATVVGERRALRGENPGGSPSALGLSLVDAEVQAFLIAPIASPVRVYGWICLVRNDGKTFSGDDEDLLHALAGQLGRTYELEYELLERQLAEKKVRKERDRAELYLDTAEVILLGLNPSGTINLINRKGCDLLGYSESELLERDWIDTCLPERIRAETRARLQRLAPEDLRTIEKPVVTKSGEERSIEWHKTLLRDELGNAAGLLMSGEDVTTRDVAIQALRTAEERMRFVLKSASVGMWDLDFKTGVVEWSDVLELQHGLEPGTFAGTFSAFVECIHPDDRAAAVETMLSHRSGGDFSMPHRTLWPDGTVRWLNGVGRIHLDEQGQPSRGVGITIDVTEQRSAEERNQQAQRMEAIGRLASGVAHDFNNLLTVILGFAELMAGDAEVESQHGNDLGEIIKAAQRAAGLTNQLLAFSRQQVLYATALDLNGLISEMTGMLGRLIGEHIDISLSLSPDLHLALADRGQIEQVVMNLVVNARDAMPDGGKLSIVTTNVELENSSFHDQPMKDGRYVMLAVTDTGEGMSRETQRRLFEPFYTTKATGKGTGLGLSTTYGIVKQSKGYVWVYSEPGRGSTFKVYLPCAEPGVGSTTESHTGTSGKRGTETLLLVEDEEGVRQFSKRALDDAGYHVLESANGDDAEQLFIQHADSIDLLVTDVVMPGCGGPELLNRLRIRAPDLKVLYMSGYTDQAVATQSGMQKDHRFVQKPFRAGDLLRHVREALDTDSLLGASTALR